MQTRRFEIDGPLLITPTKHTDARGYFAEVFHKKAYEHEIGRVEFVQDNHSHSLKSGTVRGLHFQTAPSPQAKLIRVVRGAIFDVAVDLRKSSSTYGRHVTATISADNFFQLYVPAGFAHGYCTIEDNTEMIYKVSDYYNPAAEKGLLWNDPVLQINWPVTADQAILSNKDTQYPTLNELGAWFS